MPQKRELYQLQLGVFDTLLADVPELPQLVAPALLDALPKIDALALEQHDLLAGIFYRALLNGQSFLDEEDFDRAIRIHEKPVYVLVKAEDQLYRGGQPATDIRVLKFMRSEDTGMTVVEGDEGDPLLQWLDYRYHVDSKNEESFADRTIKKGEIAEAEKELEEFKADPTPERARRLLPELGDLVFCWQKMRFGLQGKDREPFSLHVLLAELPEEVRLEAKSVLLTLSNITIWKYHYRYEVLGKKNDEKEAAFLEQKYQENSIDPFEFAVEHLETFELLFHLFDRVSAKQLRARLGVRYDEQVQAGTLRPDPVVMDEN